MVDVSFVAEKNRKNWFQFKRILLYKLAVGNGKVYWINLRYVFYSISCLKTLAIFWLLCNSQKFAKQERFKFDLQFRRYEFHFDWEAFFSVPKKRKWRLQ